MGRHHITGQPRLKIESQKYGQNIRSMPASSMIHFNSMQTTNAIIPTYGIPLPLDMNSSIKPTLHFLPMAENNPAVGWQEADRLQQQKAAQQEATRLQQQTAAQQEATRLQQQSHPIELYSVNIQSFPNDCLSHLNNTKFRSSSGKHRHVSGSRTLPEGSNHRERPILFLFRLERKCEGNPSKRISNSAKRKLGR
jgi:hypothetical protein